MATADPYKAAPKQSQIQKSLCERAAWYLNSIGEDTTKRGRLTMKEFNAAYSATQALNIPVHCKITGTGQKKRINCFCYPPLSGLKSKRRKGGKRT
jgi:hypothetical protein